MLEYEIDQGKMRIYIAGEIDHHSSNVLRKEIDDIVLRINPNVLVLNFQRVTFCDSSGIALVLGRYKQMKNTNGKLYLERLPRYVENIFLLSGVDKLVEFK